MNTDSELEQFSAESTTLASEAVLQLKRECYVAPVTKLTAFQLQRPSPIRVVVEQELIA
jgi:hypothetical protein